MTGLPETLGAVSLEIIDRSECNDKIPISQANFENFHKICRFCLGYDNLKPFFDMSYIQVSIQSIIYDFSGLKVYPEDCLPYNLCETCVADVIRCYKFKKRCIRATDILVDAYNKRDFIKDEYNHSECSDGNEDNVVIKNGENEDSPSVCYNIDRNTNNFIIKNEEINDGPTTCYNVAVKDIHTDNLNIKSEEIHEKPTIYYDNTIEDMDTGNLIIKTEEIYDAPTICYDNTIEDADTDNLIIKTEEIDVPPTIYEDNILQDMNNDNFIIKNEEKPKENKDAPIICNDNTENVIIDNLTMNNEGSKYASTVHDNNITGEFEADNLSNASQTLSSASKYSYQCNVCEKLFLRKNYLKRHMLIHSKKKYECHICKAYLKKKSMHTNHMLIHRYIRRFFKCDICQMSFTKKDHIDRHLLTHAGEQPYKCGICQRTFVSEDTLQNHMLVHTGTSTHKCSVCGKSFIERYHLIQHMAIHRHEKLIIECSRDRALRLLPY